MYNKDKWIDFERFLVTYTVEKRNNEVENKRTLGVFNGLVSSIRNQLWRSSLNYFNTTIERKRTELISNTLITKIFNSSTLGTINYRLTKVTFDRKYFDILANQAFEEQWMGNSLPQGSMPYAYCFGSGNSCDGYYCSQISVKSGGSDHLVIVKDSNGSVARHGYVKSGLTLTFNVFNGTYQVFFVSGVGWNPNKIMTFSLCGKLKGGFATEESVTKGSLIYLNNQIMTYELTLRQDGNFSAQSSSVDEAFR